MMRCGGRSGVVTLIGTPLACLLLLPAAVLAGTPLTLKDGDRVVLVGDGLIEREQRWGYWEYALTTRFPHHTIVFRNLGWSGDTVYGRARAGFDTAADGFRRLTEHVRALKPSVIVLGYGGTESFDGSPGLPAFHKGLDTVLDTLAGTKAQLIILSPIRHEDLGRPLPDPATHNKSIQLYTDVLRRAATARGAPFVDLFERLGDGAKQTPPAPRTDDGIHLTADGYRRSAAALEAGLGLPPRRWRVEVGVHGSVTADGTKVAAVETMPLRFRAQDTMLPTPPPLSDAPAGPTTDERILTIRGLGPGAWALRVDGEPVATAPARAWAAGVQLTCGPEFKQAERLRQAIIEKNRLYFYRWRPQNDTYLSGFRKGEQGQNAVEIPQFDPLVARQEVEIARLCRPAPHRYEIARERPPDPP
jgi:lysophospholipase L1-like esterase